MGLCKVAERCNAGIFPRISAQVDAHLERRRGARRAREKRAPKNIFSGEWKLLRRVQVIVRFKAGGTFCRRAGSRPTSLSASFSLAMARAKLLLFLISVWLKNESALCCNCDWFTYFECKLNH